MQYILDVSRRKVYSKDFSSVKKVAHRIIGCLRRFFCDLSTRFARNRKLLTLGCGQKGAFIKGGKLVINISFNNVDSLCV